MTSEKRRFPSNAYETSWKMFRRLSDENKVTVERLLTRSHWPRNEGLRILDIGCGDGLMIRKLIEDAHNSVESVTLLDPYEEWLNEARRHIEEECYNLVRDVRSIQGDIEENMGLLQQHDVILAVHVVYLLEHETFRSLLTGLPVGVPFYVVMDDIDSVFSRIWSRIKDTYFERVKKAHALLEALQTPQISEENRYHVSVCDITSRLPSPLLQKEKIKESMISILSYTDYEDLNWEEIEHVQKEIGAKTVKHELLCDSKCYEIVRR